MKPHALRQVLSLGLVLVFGLTGATAQVKLTNPGFAGQETLKYLETVGSVTRTVDSSLLAGPGAGARLEYRSVGAESESVHRLDPVTLLALASETLTKAPDATVRRTAEYRDLKVKAGVDDLVLTDLASLPVALRGFPWGQRTTAKITTVGNAAMGGGAFSFELTVVGKEKVTAAGKTWDCWHVTTGLGGAFAFVMAKSDWWFAVEGTHPLIKTSGPSGGPGSPMRVLVLQTYTIEK